MTPAEKAFVLAHASVPEQIVSLMSLISRGDAFLMEDYLGFAGENWLIVVGYPLQNPFSAEQCGQVVEQAVQIHRPAVLRFIGPEIPPVLQGKCIRDKSGPVLPAGHRTDATETLPAENRRQGRSITDGGARTDLFSGP